MPALRAWKIHHKGETRYIKRELNKGVRALTKAQQRVCRWMSMDMLRPARVVWRMGEEQQRLEEFRARGILVPTIIEAGNDYLILSDIGPSLTQVMKSLTDEKQRLALAIKGLEQLKVIHGKGLCHGRPLLKDMTLMPGTNEIGTLDFEEDTLAVMSPEAARTRDYFLFFCSSARHLSNESLRALAQHVDWTAPNIDAVQLKRFLKLLAPLAWMVHHWTPLTQLSEIDSAARAILILKGALKR